MKLTPVANALGLLLARVEHGGDNHEAGGDGSFTNTKESTAGEQPTEARARCMTHESNRPDENICA